MTSIIPQDITECWEYVEPKTKRVVKACAVNAKKTTGTIVPKITVKLNQLDLDLKGLSVKKCNPKRDNKCNINLNGDFYKFCDPKKDKKCKVRFEDLLLGDDL